MPMIWVYNVWDKILGVVGIFSQKTADKINNILVFPRRWGANVRCVKETKTE